MVIKWILVLTLLCPSLSLAAPALSERDWQILKNIARNGGAAGITLGTEQPLTCTPGTGPNAFFLDTDTGILSFCSATDTFLAISTGQIVTLDGAFDNGKIIDGATNLANAFRIGDGTTYLCLFTDATLGPRIKPCTDANIRTYIENGFTWGLYDIEGDADMFVVDPDAASKNAMYQFGSNYKPIASFLLPLEPRGAATSATESITTNVEKSWYLTVTDADTDAADFSFPVTARMAGATTATFRLVGVSNNASPSGNIAFDCAMTTYTPGTDTLAAHSTTGQQRITLTPATQYRPVAATSSAHTINGGALVEGDIVYGSCEVDATATTSTQMTNFRLWGNVLVQLSINSWSD